MSRNYELLRKTRGDVEPAARPLERTAIARVPEGYSGYTEGPRQTAGDWLAILGAVRRHWMLSLAFAVLVVGGTMIVTLLLRPMYEPVARLEVDPPGSEVFSLQNGGGGEVDLDRIISTQTQILTSDDLALQVVRKLRLDAAPEIAGNDAADRNAAGVESSNAERAALDYLKNHLKAVPVKESRIIEVSFSSPNARLSRDVVNTLVSLYMEKSYQSRYDAVTQSSEWLSRQLADIREKAEKSNQALADYQKAHSIGDIGGEQSTLADKVQDLNRQLTQAQADRIQLEAYSRSIQEGKGGSLPQVRDNPVVQDLTKKLADTETELAQKRVIYGKNHPSVQQLEHSAQETEQQLQRQRESIMDGIRTSYRAANAREQLMQRQLNGAMAGVSAMGEYNMLKHDAQANTELYNALYARVKEAGIAAASKSSNIRVLEQARLLSRPTWPKRLQNLEVAMAFGLLGGLFLAFARDRMDSSVRSPDEMAHSMGLPTVEFIPRLRAPAARLRSGLKPILLPPGHDAAGAAIEPFVIERPGGAESEAVRALASSVLRSNSENNPRVLLIVSAFAQEGKTTLSVNLAAALSELAPTCIVDADLRRPSVAPSLGVAPEPGIREVLNGEIALPAVLQPHPRIATLTIAPAGAMTGQAGSTLLTAAVDDLIKQLRQRFTYVVIDSPPILAYADARALAPLADAVIMVARYGSTNRQGVSRAMEILRQIHSPVSAFVINGVDVTESYAYYGKTARG